MCRFPFDDAIVAAVLFKVAPSQIMINTTHRLVSWGVGAGERVGKGKGERGREGERPVLCWQRGKDSVLQCKQSYLSVSASPFWVE